MLINLIKKIRRILFRVEYSEVKLKLYIIDMHLGLMFYNEKVIRASKAKYDITVLNPVLEVIHNLKSEQDRLSKRLSWFESSKSGSSSREVLVKHGSGGLNEAI